MPSSHFTADTFTFLRDLKKNNSRDWFNKHKARFIEVARDPMLRFIGDFAPKLKRISDHFVADDSTVGGSMFRIYRDTRFSKDKSPYKTHIAAQFRHEAAENVHAPGFYLHLEPGSVFVGAGIWRPDTATTNAIRQHIVEKTADWKRLMSSKPIKAGRFSMEGETLKRPPRGFDADHPYVEDLKRKDFIIVATLDEKTACSPKFLDEFTTVCREAKPFVKFIADAVDLPA